MALMLAERCGTDYSQQKNGQKNLTAGDAEDAEKKRGNIIKKYK